MNRIIKNSLALTITLTLLLTLVLAPTALAAHSASVLLIDSPAPPKAPSAKPHSVSFMTTGLADGVSITISGARTNPGERFPVPYSKTFISPGPSSSLTTEPGTSFSYAGFPSEVEVNGESYSLVSVAPVSPFTTGASGETTVVTAVYGPSCQPPTITSHPSSATVVVGDLVTFTVGASGSTPLSYQWRKDSSDIPGATDSSYSITSVHSSDAGSYDVLVSNACSPTPATSNPAVLTVNKANQTITFDQPTSPATFNTTFSVNPTASSGLPVSLAATGSCTNVGLQVTMTSGTGVCTLTASQAGNDDYNPALDLVRTVDAAKANQTITFDQPPSPAWVGTTFAVSPTASSGLPVTLAATGSCTNVGFQVTMISGTGVCILTTSQTGDADFAPATDVIRTVDATQYHLYLPIISG